jgi:hypothetical protein
MALTRLLALLLATGVFAAGSRADSAVDSRQAELARLKEKVVAIDKRRREDAALLEQSRAALQEAQAELLSAKTELSADDSELNARRVKNAEFALMLKQREFDRLDERLRSYDTATRQTATRMATLEKEIADIRAGRVKPAPAAQELARTQQELAEARARNEAASQEVARLRALMAQANGKPAATAAPAQASNTAPAAAIVAPGQTKPKPAAVETLSEEQRFALGQYERLAKLFREKGLDETEGPERTMMIDAMVDFWIESKRTLQFAYLGHGQYIVEARLRNGDATFIVGDRRWRYTVPEQDDNTAYMFLLDTTAKPHEQLYFFRKDLLAE